MAHRPRPFTLVKWEPLRQKLLRFHVYTMEGSQKVLVDCAVSTSCATIANLDLEVVCEGMLQLRASLPVPPPLPTEEGVLDACRQHPHRPCACTLHSLPCSIEHTVR